MASTRVPMRSALAGGGRGRLGLKDADFCCSHYSLLWKEYDVNRLSWQVWSVGTIVDRLPVASECSCLFGKAERGIVAVSKTIRPECTNR